MIGSSIRHCRHWLALGLAVLAGACGPVAPLMAAHPPIWELRDADTRILLIGSVHQLPASLDWLGNGAGAAVSAADELWLELSPGELAGAASLFAQVRHDERVLPLANRLAPDDAATIRRLAHAGGFADHDIDTSESWALAVAAGRGVLADSDFTATNGVESRLIAAMERRGKPIVGLETAADQLDAFDSLAPAVQDRLLAATAQRSVTALADARRLVAAWSRGDETALARIAANSLSDTPELVEPLVHARNRRWAIRITQRLRRPGTILVAVGTGHLVGQQSLVQLLREQGYRVTRLQQ